MGVLPGDQVIASLKQIYFAVLQYYYNDVFFLVFCTSMSSRGTQFVIPICFGPTVLSTTPSDWDSVSFHFKSVNFCDSLILLLNQRFPLYLLNSGAQERATLDEAFALYEANTCITFVERTNQRDYVSVQKTGGG